MQQQLIDWSKAILLSQSIMPRLLSAMTKENERMLNLGYGSRHFDAGMSTYDFLEHMLDINIRKRNLAELSINVTHILKDMDESERAMLEDRFFGKKSVSELMPKANIRTVYRRYNTALEHFASALEAYGYDADTLDEMLGGDKVIAAILDRVKSHAVVFRREENERSLARTIRSNMDSIRVVPCERSMENESQEYAKMRA